MSTPDLVRVLAEQFPSGCTVTTNQRLVGVLDKSGEWVPVG